MRVEGARRKGIALSFLAVVGAMAWLTMEAGRPRWLVMILLAGFGLRILLAASLPGGASRYDESSDGM